jgi:hypothetical protein
MSSHSTLEIEGLEFDSWKNDIDPAIMMLFTRSDKRLSPISEEQWGADGGEAEYWSEDLCEVKYTCTVSDMRDRLELRGYTRQVADASFRIGAKRGVKDLTESLRVSTDVLTAHPVVDPDPHYVRYKQRQQRTLEILETLSPDDWVSAIRYSREHRVSRPLELADVTELRPEVQYVWALSISWFGFPALTCVPCCDSPSMPSATMRM